MGRKNLSKRRKRISKHRRSNVRRSNKYRNSKRINSKRRYYKRRTNRNTNKRTNKFKNSNRKLKKFIGGDVVEIIIDRVSSAVDERDDMDSSGNYSRVINYVLVFEHGDKKLFLKLPEIIRQNFEQLITSVRGSIVSYFDSFRGNIKVVKSLQYCVITYKYYFRMEGGEKVELKENNTIDKDINASEINALIIELNYK